MLEELMGREKVVGAKQSRRAVAEGRAEKLFIAEDARDELRDSLIGLCAEYSTPYEMVKTMKRLGDACGIGVGSAVAAILR